MADVSEIVVLLYLFFQSQSHLLPIGSFFSIPTALDPFKNSSPGYHLFGVAHLTHLLHHVVIGLLQSQGSVVPSEIALVGWEVQICLGVWWVG